MIESAMLVVLGFLLAMLVTMLLAPAFWRRAVRLTTRRIEATMPMSVADIQADKDQLRAEFAIRLRRVEMALEKTREQAARHLVERNKGQTVIAGLQEELRQLRAALAESANAANVLEQTVKRRIPDLETQVARERDVVAMRDRELMRLGRALENQSEAVTIARRTLARRDDELDTLRRSLESGAAVAKPKRGRKAVEGEEADTGADALRGQVRQLESQLSGLRQELGDLRQREAVETGALRDELQRLASLMMKETTPAVEADEEDTSGETAGMKDAEPSKPSKSSGKSGGRRKRLRDRIKGLGAKQEENADA